MGARREEVGRIDYSEGAPPPASAFANGDAQALGASRMEEEEGDWDSDEEEQEQLAAAAAEAAKGKVRVGGGGNRGGLGFSMGVGCGIGWLSWLRAAAVGCSFVETSVSHLRPTACHCGPQLSLKTYPCLSCRAVLCCACRPTVLRPRRVVCWAALCPTWPCAWWAAQH